MTRGEIILVKFPFTDLTGSKLRPAMVLAERDQDILTAFITSNTDSLNIDEVIVEADAKNKLKQKSKINLFKLATLKKSLVLGKLGNMSESLLDTIDKKLVQILNIK
jgi:mRNA interferase MazF